MILMATPQRLALITGASSGIGATFARHLAREGYNLVLVARRVDRMESLAAELRAQYSIAVDAVAADLTLDDDVARIGALLAASPNLEMLINNAGFGTKGYFYETPAAPQDAMHRLHILATERLIRFALPGMIERRRGAIVNVSSVAAFVQGPSNISYCATKAWMNSFTEGLAWELANLGSPVQVQALCPGFTYSEFHDVMQANRAETPASWWYPADFVVAESLLGLKQGKRLVIPGLRYRLLVRLLKVIPIGLLRLGAKHFRPERRV
jgi:short-subunit dehydrogenase